MRKIKRPQIGQYVLVTKYSDKDPQDPWYVGFVNSIIIRADSVAFTVDGSSREWRNCFKITDEEGKRWLEMFGGNKS